MSNPKKEVMIYTQAFTPTEKAVARSNIGASQISYVTSTGGPPTITVGNLNIVTYQKGIHLNNGQGDIGPIPPEPASGDNGKVLTVTQTGVKWTNPTGSSVQGVISDTVNNIIWNYADGAGSSKDVYEFTIPASDYNRFCIDITVNCEGQNTNNDASYHGFYFDLVDANNNSILPRQIYQSCPRVDSGTPSLWVQECSISPRFVAQVNTPGTYTITARNNKAMASDGRILSLKDIVIMGVIHRWKI